MTLQEWIHSIEEGKGSRVIAIAVAIMAFGALAVFYDIRGWKNFSTPEAMDSAQLARNLSQGHGYTTDVIRPLSVHLIQQHRMGSDAAIEAHPDLANPPVYPVALAGLMKVLPFHFDTSFEHFTGTYQPEIWIAVFNQFLFFISVLVLFRLARKLFDSSVAWLACLIFVGTELFWRFSVSGLSTMLLIFIFLSVSWCLVRLDENSANEANGVLKAVLLSVFAGLLIGIGCLTRYSFGWIVFPAIAYLLLLSRHRGVAITMLLLAFVVVVGPWVARNVLVCGKPFGTAGYAIYQGSFAFPEDTLERSLNPANGFSHFAFDDVWEKLKTNGRDILVADVSRLGGTWLGGFLLFGLVLPFRRTTLSRARIFVLATLVTFIFVQAFGRTHLTKISPDLNSENLIVVFAPLVFAFGAALFMTLLDSWQLPMLGVRTVARVFFVLLAVLPLMVTLFVRTSPYSYPPYHPPLVREVAQGHDRNDLLMSDMPWAVAWYGERRCALLTLTYDEDFTQFNGVKRISGLYLSPVTLNRPMLEDMAQPLSKQQKTWPRFAFDALGRGEVPTGFPLTKSRADLLPDHLYLADRDRWSSAPIQK